MYTYISCPLDLPTSHPSQSPHSAKLSSLWYIHSSFPLAIYSTHHSVYISDPVSQFIPTSPSSLVSVCPFPTSVPVFLPYKEVHQYCFSRFHIYAFIYITFLFLTYFSKEWVSVFQRNWFCLDIPFKKAGKIVQLICSISEPQEVWEVGGGGECDVGCPNAPIQWSRWGTMWGRGHLDLPTWPWDGLGLFNGCWLSTYWSWQGCRMVKVGLPQWLNREESACQCKRHGLQPWLGKLPWWRKGQPTPVLWPGKSHWQRSLVDYSPRGRRVGHNLANEHTRPSTLILRVLMNHRISNLFGVGMAGMSAHKSAPVNLAWVIFFF